MRRLRGRAGRGCGRRRQRFGLAVSYVDEGEHLRGTGGALRFALDAGALPEVFASSTATRTCRSTRSRLGGLRRGRPAGADDGVPERGSLGRSNAVVRGGESCSTTSDPRRTTSDGVDRLRASVLPRDVVAEIPAGVVLRSRRPLPRAQRRAETWQATRSTRASTRPARPRESPSSSSSSCDRSRPRRDADGEPPGGRQRCSWQPASSRWSALASVVPRVTDAPVLTTTSIGSTSIWCETRRDRTFAFAPGRRIEEIGSSVSRVAGARRARLASLRHRREGSVPLVAQGRRISVGPIALDVSLLGDEPSCAGGSARRTMGLYRGRAGFYDLTMSMFDRRISDGSVVLMRMFSWLVAVSGPCVAACALASPRPPEGIRSCSGLDHARTARSLLLRFDESKRALTIASIAGFWCAALRCCCSTAAAVSIAERRARWRSPARRSRCFLGPTRGSRW